MSSGSRYGGGVVSEGTVGIIYGNQKEIRSPDVRYRVSGLGWVVDKKMSGTQFLPKL